MNVTPNAATRQGAIPPDDPERELVVIRPDDQTLPHLGVAGDTYTILLTGEDTGGRYTLIDMFVPPGGGPPPHRHDFEEMFTILEGEIEFTFRGVKVAARAGETINVPANAPHVFTNASDRPVRLLCMCSPPGQEEFFAQVGVPAASRTTTPPELDADADAQAAFIKKAVALAPQYRTELVRPNAGDSGQTALADSLGPRLGPAATFATTEHFNLQTARALTVSEANGRASIYLAALSSNLIALAFIGQMSRLGVAFYAFALILLPVLAFVGVVTFLRLAQSSIEDIAYAHRIGLLRSFYLRVSPELEPYLLVVPGTRSAAPRDGERLAASAWQLTLTTAGMVAVVNSVVVAACAGLVLEAAGVHSLAIPVAVGAVVGAGAFSLHERHHRRALDAYNAEAVDRAAIVVPPPQQRAAS
jgi:quercetin dioxygenase-like cupin family protein